VYKRCHLLHVLLQKQLLVLLIQTSHGVERWELHLRNDLHDTAGLLDLLLCESGDESGLDDEGLLWESALSEDLAVTGLEGVDDGDEFRRGGFVLVLGDEGL